MISYWLFNSLSNISNLVVITCLSNARASNNTKPVPSYFDDNTKQSQAFNNGKGLSIRETR